MALELLSLEVKIKGSHAQTPALSANAKQTAAIEMKRMHRHLTDRGRGGTRKHAVRLKKQVVNQAMQILVWLSPSLGKQQKLSAGGWLAAGKGCRIRVSRGCTPL